MQPRRQAAAGCQQALYRHVDALHGKAEDGRPVRARGAKHPQSRNGLQLRQGAGDEGRVVGGDGLEPDRLEQLDGRSEADCARHVGCPGRSGPTTNGSMAYFRIQGPTLVIEYAPQRSLDHIHTIYRDPTSDYGATFAGN